VYENEKKRAKKKKTLKISNMNCTDTKFF